MAYLAGVVNSYILNRRWTFGKTDRANALEAGKFLIVNGCSLLVSFILIFVLYDTGHLNLWVAKGLATTGGIIVNFLGSRLWVFAREGEVI